MPRLLKACLATCFAAVFWAMMPAPASAGFFEMLFGGGGSDQPQEETVIEPEMDPSETPRVSTFRTVCVRTCDGFFFPISFQTTRNAFERDEAICQATCPGAEAKLFAYPNPGGQMEQASSVEGEPYAKLEMGYVWLAEDVEAWIAEHRTDLPKLTEGVEGE